MPLLDSMGGRTLLKSNLPSKLADFLDFWNNVDLVVILATLEPFFKYCAMCVEDFRVGKPSPVILHLVFFYRLFFLESTRIKVKNRARNVEHNLT